MYIHIIGTCSSITAAGAFTRNNCFNGDCYVYTVYSIHIYTLYTYNTYRRLYYSSNLKKCSKEP